MSSSFTTQLHRVRSKTEKKHTRSPFRQLETNLILASHATMAVAKEPLIAEQHHLDVSAAADQPAGTLTATAAAPAESRRMRFLSVLARNMHYLTFIPLILVSVLGSVHVFIAAVVASGLVTCLIALSYVCHKAGLVKVSARAEEPHNSCTHTKARPMSLYHSHTQHTQTPDADPTLLPR